MAKPRARTGTTLLELIAAMILFGVAANFAVQTLGGIAQMRRVSERQQFALFEAANVMERLSILPWEELTAEKAAAISLSPEGKRRLNGGEIVVTIEAADETTEVRRIQVEVRWKNSAGEPESPARLTTWRYARPGMPEGSP